MKKIIKVNNKNKVELGPTETRRIITDDLIEILIKKGLLTEADIVLD